MLFRNTVLSTHSGWIKKVNINKNSTNVEKVQFVPSIKTFIEIKTRQGKSYAEGKSNTPSITHVHHY